MSRSEAKEPSFEMYIGDLLEFMRYCKIWKPDTFSAKKNLAVTLIVGILLSSDTMLIVTAIMDFKNASANLTSLAAYLGPLCLQTIGLIKWSYSIWKVKDIARLVETLENCHYLCMKINKNDIGWHKYKVKMSMTRRNYRIFLYGWLWLCLYGILHWCANPLILELRENGFASESNINLSRSRHLPYLGWRPWQVKTNHGYVSIFAIQFIGGLSSAIGSITYDVFYISSLMIVCAQLHHLNDSLVDVGDAQAIIKAAAASNDFEIKLKRCVDHHSEILTFLNALEVLASPAMLLQCIENIIVLIMVSFEASTVQVNGDFNTIMKLWSMLEYFLSVIAQLFVYCYYATEIRTLGIKIADSVYQSSWEQLTCSSHDRGTIRRINYLVQMLMFRAQRAILLTGGPFYVLSLETFKSVVGLAMSNSVILRQVNDQASSY